jgi:hypothetical protein
MNLDHVFIELGLSEDNIAAASVTGMAAVRTDRKGKVLAAYSEACSIRGLDDIDIESVYGKVNDRLLRPYAEAYVVVAQHAQTYKGILGGSCFRGRAWLDIAQLAWPLGYCGMIHDRNLDTLAKYLGCKSKGAGGTMSGNCETLVRVYWTMMNRYRAALLAEEVIRDIGGDTLARFRKFVGF